MKISIADRYDLSGLLSLYTQLRGDPIPEFNERLFSVWESILTSKYHYIIAGKIDNEIISSCTLIIIPNLTHGQRPYALIENVITAESHRNRGYATQLLNYAREIAKDNGCYKIMLLTGSKKESTLDFYKNAGYNSQDKTGFIQWL